MDWSQKEQTICSELQKLFAGDSSGHDYFHTLRVYRNAKAIAEKETCNKELVYLAALLHDADDRKLFNSIGDLHTKKILSKINADDDTCRQVLAIIHSVSFRGTDSVIPETIEGKIVQDADRLDALGAIGIARAFAFGGSRGRLMYDPDILPQSAMDAETYYKNEGTTVNHFYEKLFLLKNMMNTRTGRAIAAERDLYMRDYLDRFLKEWNLSL